MRITGGFLLSLGALGIFVALGMTTTASAIGTEIHNFALADQRALVFTSSWGTIIVGTILLAAGQVIANLPAAVEPEGRPVDNTIPVKVIAVVITVAAFALFLERGDILRTSAYDPATESIVTADLNVTDATMEGEPSVVTDENRSTGADRP